MGRAADDTCPGAVHHPGMPSAPSPARDRRALRSVLMALSDTRLVLGGEQVADEAQVKHLDYRTTLRGDRATVTISASGGAMTLQLRRATASELAAPGAPATPWRIDSSVDRLAVG